MNQVIPKHNIIHQLASLHRNLIELLIVVVFLGFGVGLAASSCCNLLDNMEIWGLVIGILISAGSFLYFLKILPQKPQVFAFEGFLYVIQTDKMVNVVPVERYELSKYISKYLDAAFSENPALLRAWINNPVKLLPKGVQTTGVLTGNSLLNQAIEYFFLDFLSGHLKNYFSEQGISEEEWRKFTRENIPVVLLQNRFLEMFAKPMEERIQLYRDDIESKTVSSFGGMNGILLDVFEIILPKESIISRTKQGILRIENAIFSLEFDPGMQGHHANTPPDFEEFYMQDPNLGNISAKLVKSEISVVVKRHALFSRTSWKHYRWLDSFISEYQELAEASKFLKTIGWETAITTKRILSSINREA